MFSQDLIDIKQEPPDEVDEDLASILNSDIQLTEVSPGRNGVASLNASEVTDLLSDEKETVNDKNANGKSVKANLRCKFSFCSFRARKISVLERHEAKHSIPGSYYECKYCKFMTPVHQKLQEHEAKHTNTKPFKCRKCSYRSRYRADIYHHSAKHLKEKKFKCPNEGCNFVTKWRRNIHHHILTHTDHRPHECNICDYKFKRLQDLKYHLYRHNDEKPITCDQCDFRCKTNYELGCHKLKHSSVRNYACTFPGCQQRTKTKSDLTKHMKTHSKAQDYLCPVCGKGFHMRNSLTRHMERHQDARNYKCGLCTKAFKTKATLRTHMQVHSGVKPWTCDICSRDFLNKWNMMKHKETHGENRPFKCPICPYGARVGEHLLAHIGTMHGKNFAYYCEICKKPWKRFSQLQIHMKRMHKGALRSSFGNSMKMDIKLEPGEDGDIETGCDLISVKKIDPTNMEQFKRKRGRPPKIKKEPVDIDDVRIAEGEGHSCGDPVADVVEAIVSHQKEPKCTSYDSLPVQVKHEVPSEVGPAKIVCFGEFRLPLATKGFPFNYDKNGKKPNSWFMNPENMQGKAADKQQAYLEKKERDFERRYGRKLGWRRFRLRKKPRPGVSFTSVSNKEEQDDIDSKCSQTKMEGKVESNSDSGKQEKKQIMQKHKQDPMELLIEGRKKLILMRKIKRRQKRWKQRMAEIMPSDDEFSDEEFTKPKVPVPSEYLVSQITQDGYQETSIKQNQCSSTADGYQETSVKQDQDSSDQEDDIPLSKLKTSDDLDDLPLSMLRTKSPKIITTTKGNLKRWYQKRQAMMTPSCLTKGYLSNLPPKQERKQHKRQLENGVRNETIKTKKRKSCQETTAAMETNFYTGSVRILGKTLIAESENNGSIIEMTGDLDTDYKSTISSSPAKSDLSRNDSPLKLKGKKIENIVAKLKAKKFGSDKIGNAIEVNLHGKVKKKVGRPKGSRNKIKVNDETKSEAHTSVSHEIYSTKAGVLEQSISLLIKARKGRPKGSKNKVKSAHVKPLGDNNSTAVTLEQCDTLKLMVQNTHTDTTNVKPTFTLDTSVISVTPESKNDKNKGNGINSCTKMEVDSVDHNTCVNKIKKVGRPKGSKTGVNKNRWLKKSKSRVGLLKKSKQLDPKIKTTGAIMTLQSGKVYELKPGNIWSLTEKVSNTQVECTKSTQTLVHEGHTKTRQSKTIDPSETKKSANFLSGKCKAAISVQLKNKLLDKIAKQKTKTRVSLEASDLVLGVVDTSHSVVNLTRKRKVGRPKGSKNKVGNKVLISNLDSKTVKKVKSKKQTESNTRNDSKKTKLKRLKDESNATNKQAKKKTKTCSNQKKLTNLKVTKMKQKYKQQLKNKEKGINKIVKVKGNKKVKKCLKMKGTKGNKNASQISKRKKLVCAIGSVTAKNKTVKQKSNPQVWYIDIERESADEITTNVPIVQSELASNIFVQTITDVNLKVEKPLLSNPMTTQDHIPNISVKSEPPENVIKTEPVLPEFSPRVSYTVTKEEAEDISIYREHAQAWGVGNEGSHSYTDTDDSTITDLITPHGLEDQEQKQFQSKAIHTQGAEGQETENGCAFVKDVVSLPVSKKCDVEMLERSYQEADISTHLVNTSDLVKAFPDVQEPNLSRECLVPSEIADASNSNPLINQSNCNNANNNNDHFVTSLNPGVENNGIIFVHSDSEMANVGNSGPVQSFLNFNMENDRRISSSTESHMKNNDLVPSNLNSETLVSSDSTENNSALDFSQPASHVEFEGLTSSHVNLELVNMENDSLVASLANSQIQTNELLSNNPMSDDDVTQIRHDLPLSDCNKTDEPNDDIIITKRDCEMGVVVFSDLHATGSDGKDDLPNDNHIMAQLYSQVEDQDHAFLTAASDNTDENVSDPFHNDTIACSTFEMDDEIHSEDKMHVVKSPLHHANPDLSYKVVLADSEEEHFVSDIEMFKPSIKTEIGCLPIDCARRENLKSTSSENFNVSG
ncbi:uncharacterized protein LOC121389488 [Gigantopelta aegis]|uniref:uncharacterized protein LOC121389488 n=1 Tax=Gigantopelta aegis TaxID=1735272 RepID=UPI001B88B575|nr:uncharacterized protein LOC121389488 [Gigantopelta aegis]